MVLFVKRKEIMKTIRIFTYLIACCFSIANLFYLKTQSPFQLLFFSMVFNVLAGVMSIQAYLNDDKISKTENLKFNMFCWIVCAILWTFRFLSV